MYGSRQVGKTSLVKRMLKNTEKVYIGDGNDANFKLILESQSLPTLINAFKGYNIVFIDEAQKIKDIGTSLKLMVDHIENIKFIACGSSSFDLSNKVGEPLTGRQHVCTLFPVSILELNDDMGGMRTIEQLENRMIFGIYRNR